MESIKKRAIALLITMMFIMAITLSIGIGLKYTTSAQDSLKNENFLLQTSVIIDDILTILKTSKELDLIAKDKSGLGLFIFLSQASFIPIEYLDIKIALELSSARSKFNINSMHDKNTTKTNLTMVSALKTYTSLYMINPVYVDILLDGMGGIKDDNSYNSDIFNDKPTLFRDYITNNEHLKEFNHFYTNNYYDNSLSKINFEEIFYYSKDKNMSIDMNYVSAEVWKLMLGIEDEQANELALNGGNYTKDTPPNLSDEQNIILQSFNPSYYEPYIDVKLEIIQDKFSANIAFEYDIQRKQGYNFHYEI